MSANERVRIWKDDAGEWRFTHWRSSDRIATSEGYKNLSHVRELVASIYPDITVEVEGEDG